MLTSTSPITCVTCNGNRTSTKGFKLPCKHCSVDGALTHPNINDLSNYGDSSTMRRYHDVTLYGEKYRGPYNHD